MCVCDTAWTWKRTSWVILRRQNWQSWSWETLLDIDHRLGILKSQLPNISVQRRFSLAVNLQMPSLSDLGLPQSGLQQGFVENHFPSYPQSPDRKAWAHESICWLCASFKHWNGSQYRLPYTEAKQHVWNPHMILRKAFRLHSEHCLLWQSVFRC